MADEKKDVTFYKHFRDGLPSVIHNPGGKGIAFAPVGGNDNRMVFSTSDPKQIKTLKDMGYDSK